MILFKKISQRLLILGLFATGMIACVEDEKEQIVATFGPEYYTVVTEGSVLPASATINFSLPLYEDSQVKIKVNNNGARYGIDYTTDPPELVAGEIIVPAATGNSQTSFTVTAINNDEFTNGVKLEFSILGLNGALKSTIGKNLTVEIIDNDLPAVLADIVFDGCEEFEVPKPFFQEYVPGFKTDRGWNCRPFGFVNDGVQASAFGGEPGSDNSWLILDMDSVDLNAGGKLDVSQLTSLYFGLWVESYFGGPGTISLFYSFDYPGTGNPEEYTWNTVDGFVNQLPPAGSGNPDGLFVPVFVSLNDLVGQQKAYLAFQYYGGSSSNSSSWTIDELQFYGE